MISIYEYICENIKDNGKLKEGFNLDKYNYSDEELKYELGAIDGISYFHTNQEEDKELINFIKKSLKLIDENNVEKIADDIELYFNKTDKRILSSIDNILKWIMKDNTKKLNFNNIIKLALYLVLCSTNIETVKLGIGIIGLADISDDYKIQEVLLKLALCDEFTLFVIIALRINDNANDLFFMLLKKVDGWGKIHLVNYIEVNNDTIKEWLLINGCDNKINLGYTALEIARKIDLINVLNRSDFSYEEFCGISNIMRGLFDYGPIKLDVNADIYSNIIEKYLKIFRKFIDDLNFYDVLILMSMFINEKEYLTRKDIKNAKEIVKFLDSEVVLNTLRKSIESDEKLYKVINIIKYNNNINLYNEVFDKFKNKPLKYYYCLEYLIKNDIFRYKSLKEIESYMDFDESSGKPESVFGMDNEYANSMTGILQALQEYPFNGNRIVIAGIKSKYMILREASLNVIEAWIKYSNKEIKDFPNDIYKAIVNLQKEEVIKDYRLKINRILNIDEDLSEYIEPKIIWSEENDSDINIDLYDDKLDELFQDRIRYRGEDYYNREMIYSCSEVTDGYLAYVQGSDFGKEYEVKIKKNNNGLIKSMSCNCPYQDYCKHEYATILYLRNRANR